MISRHFWLRCLFTLFSLVHAVQAGDLFAAENLPVIHINATQRTPLEAGLENGTQAKRLFPDVERRYDAHLASLFRQDRFDLLAAESLPVLWQQVDIRFQEEFKGIAAAWNLVGINRLGDGLLSNDELKALNLLADLGQPTTGSGFAVMGKVSAESNGIIGRNLDWQSSPELRSLQAISVHEYPDHALVNIGFAGLLSVLAGFNDSGVFLTALSAEPPSPYGLHNDITPQTSSVGFALRTALFDNQSVYAATRSLLKLQFGSSQNILSGDRRLTQVIEYPTQGKGKVRTWKSPLHSEKAWGRKRQIAVVNCNMLAELPDNCVATSDTVRWLRLQELAHFNPDHPAQTTDVSAILSDTANDGYELFNKRTLQSILYLPGNSGLFVYAAPQSDKTPVTNPTHRAYLELLPASLRHKQIPPLIQLGWIIWALLLVKTTITVWLFREPIRDTWRKVL